MRTRKVKTGKMLSIFHVNNTANENVVIEASVNTLAAQLS